MIRFASIALLGLVTLALVGCDSLKLRWPTLSNPAPVAEATEAQPFTPYPAQVPLGDDFDIVVQQYRDHVTLDNRTARTYQDVQLWLNQQYVTQVKSIEIGPGNSVPLDAFINEHGETYPIAGLLTPDRGFPVLAAEIYNPQDGKRHRLLARK